MKLNKEQREFLKWLWQSKNKAIWIETFVKINDKTGKLVPFKPTVQQKEFLEGIERKNIILKLRQNGMSVISLGEMLRLAITKANTVSAMYSYEEDSAKDNFDKLKQMYYSLPNWIREEVTLDRNNDISLEFSNGSVITAKTVGTGRNDKGRGKTINGILHLTEFAFYKNAEKQLTSLSKSCSSSAKIIVESTANGVGNLFHSMWLGAINKESSYKAFFFPWFTAKELFAQDYKIAAKEYKKIHKGSLNEKDLDEEERQLYKQHNVTLEMLMWRRLEIANDGGLNKFHQERPAFPDQAFLSTGAGIFDNDVLNMLEQSIQRDLKLNKLTLPKGTILKELPKELHYYYNKELKVYHKYNSKLRYYVGVDCGKGLGQDYTVITVYNTNKEECAIFRSNKIAPWEMSSIVKDIGVYYGKAMMVIETASGGDTILDKLKNTYKYPIARIYKYKSYVNRTRKTTLGFSTNNQTKSLIIENLKELIESRQDSIQINSIEFVQELKVFVDENGKMGAMGGYHDDIVMATAICLYALVKNVWGQIWF